MTGQGSKTLAGYFYPRPPRGGRPPCPVRHDTRTNISIHALREEGDRYSQIAANQSRVFLSTPSARRATSCACFLVPCQIDFYPRPPRGGRPVSITRDIGQSDISIHALREEGDHTKVYPMARPDNFYPRPPRGGRRCNKLSITQCTKFLSTPSARRATKSRAVMFLASSISIHALREEGDRSGQTASRPGTRFLSTPSARRAT